MASKIQKNTRLEAQGCVFSRLLILLAVAVFSISLVSAIELNPFAVTKLVEKEVKADMSEFLKTDFNSEYGVIRLSKTIFWIPTDKIAEYSLTYNTPECYLNCEAKGKAVLYTDGSLFEDINFKDARNNLYEMDKYQFWLFNGYETKIRDICLKYDESTGSKGEEFIVEQQCLEYGKEEYQEEIWLPYKYETLTAGDYQWRLTGSKKSMTDSVDWLATTNGKVLTEWAWWLNAPAKYVYVGGSTNQSVLKYLASDFSLVAQSSKHGGTIYDLVLDEEYIYYAGATNLSIFKLYKENLSKVTNSSADTGTIYSLAVDNNYIYSGGDNRTIKKYWKSNLSYISSLDYGERVRTIKTDDTYFYYGGYTGILRKGYLSNFTNFTSATTGIIPIMTITLDNDYIYYGGDTNYSIQKAYKENLSKITNSSSYGGQISKLTQDENYIYAGGNNASSSTIVHSRKYWKSNLSLVSTSASYGESIRTILADNSNLYIAGSSNNVWKIEPSDMSKISNSSNYGGSINALGIETLDLPIVTLNSPINYYNSSTTSIDFNATVVGTIVNVSLYLDGILNETNTSGINDTDYLFTETIADGEHNWTIESCNDDGCTTSDTRTFTIDTTPPTVNITSPYPENYTYDYHKLNTNLTINFTAVDTNRDKCWYNYDGTNTTVTCADSTFNINITNASDKDIIFYANDTIGNEASITRNWDYRLLETGQSYTATVLEGASTSFAINFTTNGTEITTAYLNYNGTRYGGTITDAYTITKTITAPEVATSSIIPFFWEIIMRDGFAYNTTSTNQTVTPISIDNCAVNTIALYNFTIKDEALQTELNESAVNTSAKVDLVIRSYGTDTEISTYYKAFTTNPFGICVNSSLTTQSYNIDVQVEYSAVGYDTEFYHIQNETLNSSSFPTNITLYDLNTSTSQAFKVVFKDSAFLSVEDALIYVYRKYIDEGVFKIVEVPKTDANGETIAHLVTNDVIYNFVVKKYGVTLGTYSNVRPVCQNPTITTCTIDFNAFASTIVVPDYTTTDDFNYTLAFNKTSREISTQFAIPSGSAENVTLIVVNQDALSTTMCTDSVVSSSGTLTCTVPESFGNGTATARLYKSSALISYGSVSMSQTSKDIYGSALAIIAVMVLMTILGAGLSDNPVYTAIFLFVGVLLLFAMNILDTSGYLGKGASVVYLLIAIVLIIIKGSKRN